MNTVDMTIINQLVESLDSDDMLQRTQAKHHLIALGSSVVEILIQAMQTNTRYQCWVAASILAEIDDPRWFEPMVVALSSENRLLSQTAVNSLAKHGNRAVEPFLKALPDVSFMVQCSIVQTLGEIRDPRAFETLMWLLETTDSGELQRLAIQALGKLGNPAAIPVIRPHLQSENHHVSKRARLALEALAPTDHDNDNNDNVEAIRR